jgi:uncharacterized protein (DUF885 family)
MNRTILLFIIASIFSISLAGCGETGSVQSEGVSVSQVDQDTTGKEADTELPEHEQLNAYLAEVFADNLSRQPFTASYLGIKDRHGEWNPQSEAFNDEERLRMEQGLLDLARFDRAALPNAGKLSLDLYRMSLERSLAMDNFRHHRYALHQFSGAHTRIPSSLINIHRVADLSDAEAYIDRIENVEGYLGDVIEQLELRAEKGFYLVDWMYPAILESSNNVISGQPFDDSAAASPVWADFQKKVTALDLPEDETARLVNAGRAALIDAFKPAYQRFISVIEKQSESASSNDGVWRLPDGDAFYQRLLQWYTTTDLTADEVHQLGLNNIARIHDQMREIMAQVNFEGSLQAFFVFVRENQSLRFPNTDEGRKAYLTSARNALSRMEKKLPDYFGVLPKAELIVKRVEPFRERNAGKAFYQSPPPDGKTR